GSAAGRPTLSLPALLMLRTRVVPTVVPSVVHSSLSLPALARKNASPPTATNSRGLLLPTPTLMSTRFVVVVPSLTHGSAPAAAVTPVKSTLANATRGAPLTPSPATSCTTVVPVGVPSLRHSCTPSVPLSAAKYTKPPNTAR